MNPIATAIQFEFIALLSEDSHLKGYGIRAVFVTFPSDDYVPGLDN